MSRHRAVWHLRWAGVCRSEHPIPGPVRVLEPLTLYGFVLEFRASFPPSRDWRTREAFVIGEREPTPEEAAAMVANAYRLAVGARVRVHDMTVSPAGRFDPKAYA